MRKRVRETNSHLGGAARGATAGRPSRPSESPARETWTSRGTPPVFAMRMTERVDAGSTRRAGAAANATGGYRGGGRDHLPITVNVTVPV